MITIRDLEPKRDPKGCGGPPKTPLPLTTKQFQELVQNTEHGFWFNFIHGFNVGHVIIIIGMLATAVWWFINYDREITVTKLTVSNQVELFKKLSERVDGIDEHGTHFSQSKITQDFNAAAQIGERVHQLEAVNLSLLPRIEKMDASIQNINEWVKEQKDNK